MSTHDARHDALLQRWSADEVLAEEDRAELERCDTCRARQSEIEAVTAELRELGATERDAEIETARRSPAPEWEDRALATLERAMGAGRTPRRSRRWLAGLAAAAAVLAILVPFGPDRSETVPAVPVWLGPSLPMAPAGEVERVETFRWTHETTPLGRYEIALYLPGASSPFRTATTYETRWSPDSPDPLPAHFVWEVRAYDDDELVATGRAEVLVSPH